MYIINIMYICTLKQKSIFIVFLCLLLLILNTCENPFMVKLLEPLIPQNGQENDPQNEQDNTIYTITFNANGGEGTVQPIVVKAGEGITLPNGNELSKEGYLFSGWNSDANGTGITFTEGSTYTPVNSITLYAVWVDAMLAITITFDTNGGNGTVQPIIANAGEEIILPNGSGLHRVGYIFVGWNTNVDGTGITYTADIIFTPISNITLYAVWKNGFSNAVELGIYLDGMPANTADDPYNIVLNDITNIGDTLQNRENKYVYLDLSGSAITTIPSEAFFDCDGLIGITIPNSVTSIGENAFLGCDNLTGITIPNSVTSIGINAFSRCTSLISVTIPDSVTSIGEGVFYNCSSLTSVTIPNSVTSIGINAFSRCTSLISVTIPDSVTSIEGAFSRCTSLTSLTIGSGVTSIVDTTFYDCSSLTSVTIPDRVTSIGMAAFGNCSSLTNVTIGSGVTSIGSTAFSNCSSLTSVTIPDRVASIGMAAFDRCTSLTSVTFQGTIPSSGFHNNAFSGDLRDKFYATDATNGTPGTYTTTAPVNIVSVWREN